MDKVPSQMAYNPDGSFRWGYQVSANASQKNDSVIRYMKLLLDPSQEKNSNLADPLGVAKNLANLPYYKKPVDAVADYLRQIRLHALKVLSGTYGSEFWKVLNVEYHLTIPAVSLALAFIIFPPVYPDTLLIQVLLTWGIGLERICKSIDFEGSHSS